MPKHQYETDVSGGTNEFDVLAYARTLKICLHNQRGSGPLTPAKCVRRQMMLYAHTTAEQEYEASTIILYIYISLRLTDYYSLCVISLEHKKAAPGLARSSKHTHNPPPHTCSAVRMAEGEHKRGAYTVPQKLRSLPRQ